MATHLDLEEQEQVDQLKAFWKQYGNLITWSITFVLAAFAAWNAWNWWQKEQSIKASSMFEELDRAVTARDIAKSAQVFNDLKDRFGGTTQAEQGGLLTAELQITGGQVDAAKISLAWVAEHAREDEYRALAQLRLAGLLIDAKAFDEAAKQLQAVKVAEFQALSLDRQGDLAMAQGKKAEAVQAWTAAWKAMDDKLDLRRIIEAKLVAQAAAPSASAPGAGATP